MYLYVLLHNNNIQSYFTVNSFSIVTTVPLSSDPIELDLNFTEPASTQLRQPGISKHESSQAAGCPRTVAKKGAFNWNDTHLTPILLDYIFNPPNSPEAKKGDSFKTM